MPSLIQPTTLDFLNNLTENNNRDWFLANKKQYDAAKNNVLDFTANLLKEITAIDPTIADLEPKKCLFRINRDVRFSKDKSPYKTNFGISLSKGGKKANSAGYYINIQPGDSFIGGGLYMPMPDDIKKIREEIDYNFEEFLEIITAKSFTNFYGKMTADENLTLKRPPKGYEAENPAVEYLKWKSYTAISKIDDKEVSSEKFIEKCVEGVRALKPLVIFLNRSVTLV